MALDKTQNQAIQQPFLKLKCLPETKMSPTTHILKRLQISTPIATQSTAPPLYTFLKKSPQSKTSRQPSTTNQKLQDNHQQPIQNPTRNTQQLYPLNKQLHHPNTYHSLFTLYLVALTTSLIYISPKMWPNFTLKFNATLNFPSLKLSKIIKLTKIKMKIKTKARKLQTPNPDSHQENTNLLHLLTNFLPPTPA